MFHGYCGFEGAIIFDFSRIDIFSHAIPGRIEYRTFSSNTIRAKSIELHQNGVTVVKSALKWLQNLFIL